MYVGVSVARCDVGVDEDTSTGGEGYDAGK